MRFTCVLGAMLAAGLVLGSGGTAIGKPGPSHPLQLEPLAPYVATEVFDSSALDPSDLGATVDQLNLSTGIEIADDGVIYTLYEGGDSSDLVTLDSGGTLPRERFTGVTRWDGQSLELVSETSYVYGGAAGEAYDFENYTGEYVHAFDVVPTITSSVSGPLAGGDVVVLRWVADDPATTTIQGDDIAEIVRLRPTFDAGAFTGFAPDVVLHAFPQPGAYGGRVKADGLGNLYVRIPQAELNQDNAVEHDFWLFSPDGSGGFDMTDILPTGFAMEGWIEADDAGNLYALAKDWTDDSGTIFRRGASGTWSAYASFSQKCCIEAFQRWTFDGDQLLIALREQNKSRYYLAPVDLGDAVVHGDRIADTSVRSVLGLTADGDGGIYVMHVDRLFVDNVYEVDRVVIYRLEEDASGGGEEPGPGNGNGRGNNK